LHPLATVVDGAKPVNIYIRD